MAEPVRLIGAKRSLNLVSRKVEKSGEIDLGCEHCFRRKPETGKEGMKACFPFRHVAALSLEAKYNVSGLSIGV
jgi:hypothetical protein